ncbi:hypothetical protein RIF29_41194 [Crotalaria pallida]|uniref:Uncharacterized protein n=1 Tax=Crotalaria pallida TaxID=3830 RepID=A0AAN9HP50_CROPI
MHLLFLVFIVFSSPVSSNIVIHNLPSTLTSEVDYYLELLLPTNLQCSCFFTGPVDITVTHVHACGFSSSKLTSHERFMPFIPSTSLLHFL